MDKQVTAEQAAFIEEKTKQYFDYIIDCFDRARTEGNNVMQWLFGVITGGIALTGALVTGGHDFLAAGVVAAVGAATYAAKELIPSLKSRYTMPPGNLASSLNTMLDDSIPNMRWREAIGMDGRIQSNLEAVKSLTAAIDNARIRLSLIPAWFVGGIVAAYLINYFFRH